MKNFFYNNRIKFLSTVLMLFFSFHNWTKLTLDSSNIISCNGIGEIQFSMNLKEIEAKLGKSNIHHDTTFAGDMDFMTGETLRENRIRSTAKTPKGEVVIWWKKGNPENGIEELYTRSPYFQFQNGVKVGMSLRKLIELNGEHFDFHGFGWDYSGFFPVRPSNGRFISEYPCFYGFLNYSLHSTKGYGPVKNFLGDGVFSTKNKGLPLDEITLFQINIRNKSEK